MGNSEAASCDHAVPALPEGGLGFQEHNETAGRLQVFTDSVFLCDVPGLATWIGDPSFHGGHVIRVNECPGPQFSRLSG